MEFCNRSTNGWQIKGKKTTQCLNKTPCFLFLRLQKSKRFPLIWCFDQFLTHRSKNVQLGHDLVTVKVKASDSPQFQTRQSDPLCLINYDIVILQETIPIEMFNVWTKGIPQSPSELFTVVISSKKTSQPTQNHKNTPTVKIEPPDPLTEL